MVCLGFFLPSKHTTNFSKKDADWDISVCPNIMKHNFVSTQLQLAFACRSY